MIEAGRIVARLCRVYGWTPDYCLDRLSWPQVLMYLEYSIDTGLRGPENAPRQAAEAQLPGDSDIPDAPTIERELGRLIKRDIYGR